MAFEFKERKTIHLDIAGNAFDLEYNGTLLKKTQDTGTKMVEYAADPESINDTPEDMAYFVYDRIDDILGAGASEKIFSGRSADFVEATDVFRYITNEISNAGKNRQQRRAAAVQPPKNKQRGGHYHGKHKK